mmetsp:Transcript_7082/g.10577  ORF Transcript_7082/g.10577 Transcript_7082/m.10577 type:complete len:138 (-) Transcript_7082:250-663(-)|eukprot:CAMPEP_0185018344 /NCGR_PEP_ID=MMETSP1103-20130426/1099_1 /TAXON_ID=36769 /ORGANISM="Paraphysomonas bandaiensis, Strain Caron Lab Isolate" /LENGTH=137 /DNA_ID=CAMNT_0027548123 /DNA_START=54 /DNA_END=467 /DNA_ORIENTATION=+
MNDDDFLQSINLYDVLEIKKEDLSHDEDKNGKIIRKAYLKKARVYHPDKWTEESGFSKEEGAEQFKLLANAFQVLSDPIRRREYDNKNEIPELKDDPLDVFEMACAFGVLASSSTTSSSTTTTSSVPPSSTSSCLIL